MSAEGQPTGGQPLTLHQLSCASIHDFQLVSIDRAEGSSLAYPDETYWQGPVRQACRQDLAGFTRRPVAATLTGAFTITFFLPTKSSWSFGDRTVYCVLQAQPPLTGSVRG